ncbi:MAG: MBOAT family O-acyltransferase [Candidatus Sulfotelmatobacter sp.]
MPFNSFGFLLLFLPLALTLYYAKLDRLQPKVFIIVVSLVSYGIVQPRELPLLIASVVFNWLVSQQMRAQAEQARRKRWLIAGIIANVGFLCWFKYLGFIFSNVTAITGIRFTPPHMAWPLGISFFTVQQIMYLVDCYEDLISPNGLVDHTAFVSFFAYITAGPITRSQQVVPQLQLPEIRNVDFDRLARAIMLFLFGLAKKVVLADNLALVGSTLPPGHTTLLDTWFVVIAYALQIYFDFSGYSDMAKAVALMFNIEIPSNFNTPFRALSVTEFWQRWHITLTRFITTYLYTPIVRSFRKVTLGISVFATIAAMFICGLWHGSAWTYVIWGTLHGVALGFNQIWKRYKLKLPDPLAWILTFGFLNIGFAFFRAPNVSSALTTVAAMFGWGLNGRSFLHFELIPHDLLLIGLGMALACLGKNSDQLTTEFTPSWRNAIAATALGLVSLLYLNSTLSKVFIYRDF